MLGFEHVLFRFRELCFDSVWNTEAGSAKKQLLVKKHLMENSEVTDTEDELRMSPIITSSSLTATATIPVPHQSMRMQNRFIEYNIIEEEQHAYAVSKARDSAMFNRIVNGISRGMRRHNEKTFCHGHSMEDIVYQVRTSRSLDNIYRNHFEEHCDETPNFQNKNRYENIRSYPSSHGDSSSGLTDQVDSDQSDDTCDCHMDLPLRRSITTSNFVSIFSERTPPSFCGQAALSYHQNEAALGDCDDMFCLDL
eukprot:CAMPEP_0198291158 /NCGR_PEP_ID=MMETSP1449-20131203/8786_1 /TAXON_ID=420275 /ORGANISM="Attheya septentrionalis, Strain CCMP2084" /LENGTH=251 /DNA_ID=CAMNT_0043989763 /DNA_START=1 /DNA_END=756 /DNA_ORIENTATION=-